MRKIYIALIIIVCVVVTFLANITIGDYVAARIATLPFIKKFNILHPRAPIVINNRETVRVSDTEDAVEITDAVKSKLSTLVYYEGGRIVASGGLLNWTTDGYFIGTKAGFQAQGKTYAVVMANGDIFPITTVITDTASELVLVVTDNKNISTIETVEDKVLRPGQKLLFLGSSIGAGKITFLESYVSALSHDVSNKELQSDQITRGVFAQPVGPLLPGYAVITLDGKAAGIWTGSAVISSDAIRTFANNYFNNNKTLYRSSYGFTYKHLTAAEAKAVQSTPGALVTAITAGLPAQLGGLQVGDTIVTVNELPVTDTVLLESLLETTKPADRVSIGIVRTGVSTTVIVTPKLLQ